jgi:acetyl-CoA carboxylase biotin carboxylase subunit
MFQRILIANRGEIALRVIRACHDLGIEAVAVFSEADRGAPYLDVADRAICIGPPPATESYLRIPRLIAAAEKSGAQAIHPGYGFLSENADFANKCRESGLEFIGPPPEAMLRLGDKDRSRTVAAQAGVPTVPGTGIIESEAEALAFATRVGYPVLIKASAGGGGKGMRVVREESALSSALSAARQEAEAAFKDGRVFMEKYLDRPRHVEVQLLGDKHGTMLHLWERDCSMQRRHQKLVEESPAPNLPEEVRRSMCASAVRLATAAGYYSAGTCEFLVDQQNNYYFIEVNARIQVEHPVSELVTGIDLVREQIRVASGEPLGYTQEAVVHRGCAIECRINAEDPNEGFRGSPGTVTRWQPPGGQGVRLDTHVVAGYRVPPNYDSLVAKLLVYQPTRERAIATMRRALSEFRIEGIKTTIPIQLRIMNDRRFIEGKGDTTYLEREMLAK